MKQERHLTFKENADHPRHNWLRLTPAYSEVLVRKILTHYSPHERCVLDPFSGTATTSLVSIQMGFDSFGIEINPFLNWFGNVKLSDLSDIDEKELEKMWMTTMNIGLSQSDEIPNIPKIFKVDRWWTRNTQFILGRMKDYLDAEIAPNSSTYYNLLVIAHLNLVEATANIERSHQSLSFGDGARNYTNEEFRSLCKDAFSNVQSGLNNELIGSAKVVLGDSIYLENLPGECNLVITSPPYCNRMSYIRELRPFMYWNGDLSVASDASELDWKCMGGTWGVATSNLNTWRPRIEMPSSINIDSIKEGIIQAGKLQEKKSSNLMACYVHKYLHDMYLHLNSLKELLPDEEVSMHYIVGNSSFYGYEVPIQKLIAIMMESLGFQNVAIHKIRKRSSKKELYEYDVSVNGATVDYSDE